MNNTTNKTVLASCLNKLSINFIAMITDKESNPDTAVELIIEDGKITGIE